MSNNVLKLILRFGKFLYSIPILSLLLRFLWDHRFDFSKAKTTKHGFKFIGPKDMLDGNYEKKVQEKILELINQSDVFVNFGANIGYYVCLVLNKNKHVVAIEPMKDNLKLLYRNVNENKFSNIEIFPVAVSNKASLTKIYGGGTGASLITKWANSSDSVVNLVPTTTIDYIIGDRFKNKKVVVLMDVEGAEFEALLGAEKFLKTKPTWIIEISGLEKQSHGSINPNYSKILNLFWSLNYDAYDFENDNKKITEQDLKAVMKGNKTFGANILFNTIDKTV